jgi:hypothetical protein
MKKIYLMFLSVIFVFAVFLGFAPSTATYADTDFHAYLGIQTNTKLWIFRNAYDDSSYGFGTDAFSGLHSVSGTKLTSYAGTFTDASLTKDGTYTVTLDKPDFQSETTMSQLYVSTDIPMYDSIKVTNVIVTIDGKAIYTFKKGILNPESYTYVQIMCLNIWNDDVKALFSSALPFTKCEITFTISGLEKAAAAKEAVKDFAIKMSKDHAIITGYTGSATSVTLPSTAYGKAVTEIGKYAFSGTKLTSVTIPKSITTIGNGAFASCTSLKKFTVEKGNASFVVKDGVLFSKDLKTLVQYPAGNTAKSYTVPSSVTKIQAGAFEGCTKLTKVTISNKVTSIGKDAFKGDTKLTIYAPSGSVAYKYATDNKIKVKKS